MENIVCKVCGEKQWSILDCNYVKLFGHCWSEDKRDWQEKKLELQEFEKREMLAIQKTTMI